MAKQSKRRRKLIALVVLVLADLLFFSLVNPNNVYAIVIILGFVLLGLTIYTVLDFLSALAERVIPFAEQTRKRIILSGTIVLSLLLAMQSIGQLTPRDILAVVPLLIVISFYFSYVSTRRS